MSPSQATKILILEDEPAIADAICYSLEREGYEVNHQGTCGTALAALSQQQFHLAIFDVGLPDGSGFDLCKQIRKSSDIPIIFLSARSDEIDRVVGLEIGADDYITKPFSPRELVARVKAMLRRNSGFPQKLAPPEHPQKNSTLGIEIDTECCLIRYRGQTLTFTKAEYQLLRTLHQQPGRVFSREQLLNHISDDPGASLDRVIDAHIKSIRAKLKNVASEGAELIETRRGLGYAMRRTSQNQ